MSFTRYEIVAFGGSKAGLTTVGYQLYDLSNSPVGARVSAGIDDIGGGQYSSVVECPDGFRGLIKWDTGGGSPVYASAEINPPELSPQDAEDDARLDRLEDEVEQIDKLIVSPDTAEGTSSDEVVRATIPEIDDCKVLTRFKAFIVDQGALSVLEHIFRDRKGNPVNLSRWLTDTAVSQSTSSSSSSGTATGSARVRVKEFVGVDVGRPSSPVWELDDVSAFDPSAGILRCKLEASLVENSGIYELHWAVCDSDGNPVMVDRAILSIERSQFPVFSDTVRKDLGPPTLQEIRMRLRDSAGTENLLLDDIEFHDEQILLALAEPVRFWNESPPPIELYNTRNFPYRGAWISGVLAQLHLMAANHYRRNRLAHSAGGTTVDDKNKEREYLGEGQRLWAEYKDWCLAKKVEHNMKRFCGQNVSQYSWQSGW